MLVDSRFVEIFAIALVQSYADYRWGVHGLNFHRADTVMIALADSSIIGTTSLARD